MIRSFLSLVSVALLAPAVGAQVPAFQHPVAGDCANGQCRVGVPAVQAVRAVVGQVTQAVAPAQYFAPVSSNTNTARGGLLTGLHSRFMAVTGRLVHSGRFVAGATKEGIGFSSSSPQEAIRSSCYWGQAQPVQIGVRRGIGGWYATVQYR